MQQVMSHIIPVLDLHGYLLVSVQSSRRPWWSGSEFMVSLHLILATSAYQLLPSRVVSICDLQRLVPHARTATGQRSFAVNGPATWNRLPLALRSRDLSESAFKRAPKTHLFSTAWRHWDVFIILALNINIQIYLLTYVPIRIWQKLYILLPSSAAFLRGTCHKIRGTAQH